MAEKEIFDCERMVMRAQYLMSLKAASSNAGTMSDMEREDYRRQIAELLQGMTTLLEVNKKMGKDLAEARASLEKANKRIDILNSELSYLKGKQAASNRHRYGDRNEKGKGASAQSRGGVLRMRMRMTISSVRERLQSRKRKRKNPHLMYQNPPWRRLSVTVAIVPLITTPCMPMFA